MEHCQVDDSASAHDRILAELACDYSIVARIEDGGRVVCERVDDRFATLLGHPHADPFGELFTPGPLRRRAARSFIHTDDFAALAGRAQLFLDGPWRECQEEFRVVAKSGDVRWLRQTLLRRRDPTGGATRIYAAVHDITPERRTDRARIQRIAALEERLRERRAELDRAARRLRRLRSTLEHARRLGTGADLAGRVAQVIRSPLVALLGSLELQAAECGRTPELEQSLRLAQRLEELVERTLGLFASDELELVSTDPAALLIEAAASVTALARKCGAELSVDCEAGLGPLELDRALLGAALTSMVENAVESAGAGGRVWLTASRASRGNAVELRIADDGPGVPAELRERIFEPFFTRRATGAGLGLAIARGVVEAHGGRISVADRPGRGALFRVDLPG